MKLIIDIPELFYNNSKKRVSSGIDLPIDKYVANGKPYEEPTSGDLISREALKKNIEQWFIKDKYYTNRCHTNIPKSEVFDAIDNAPTVTPEITDEDIQNAIKQGYNDGYEMAKAKYERPKGEWIEFADYVASNVVCEDFSEDVDFYAEVLCRKLVKLGLVKLDGDTYKYCGENDGPTNDRMCEKCEEKETCESYKYGVEHGLIPFGCSGKRGEK